MHIEEPTLSIDRVSFLVNSPSLAGDGKKATLKERADLLTDIMLRYPDHLDSKSKKDLGQTENYFHHFRLRGGFDLQYAAKNKLRKKIGEAELIGFHIPKEFSVEEFLVLARAGFFEHNSKTVNIYKGESSDYGIRIEYNPNHVTDYSSLNWFLSYIVPNVNPFYKLCLNENSLIKFTRLDLAVDYPYSINPLMFTSRSNKMSFYSSKKHGVETVYFGTSRSKKQVRLYNKRVEMIEQGQGYCDNENLWRFEMSFADSFFIDDSFDSGNAIFSNPFTSFKYYDFDAITNLATLKFEERAFLHAANSGVGIEPLIAEHFSLNYQGSRAGQKWRERFKNRLEELQGQAFSSIVPPSEVYNEQFFDCYQSLKSKIKGAFNA